MIISVERCEKATNKHDFRCLQVALFYGISYKSFLESDRYDGDDREAVPFEY